MEAVLRTEISPTVVAHAVKTLFQILRLLVLTSLMVTGQAQEVSIPDPALNTFVRLALGLQYSVAPLTTQDLLSLTNLDAGRCEFCPVVSSLEGLEAAQNLTSLFLQGHGLMDASPLSGLPSLTTLNQLVTLTNALGAAFFTDQ